MGNFFKSFGKGILYVLVLPVLIIILGVYAVAALVGFIYLTIKSLILFFTGRSLFDDLPEDKKAKAIIKANTINPDDYIPEGDMPAEPEPEEKPVNKNIYKSEDDNAASDDNPFYVPEYLKPHEEVKEEPEPEEEEEDLVGPEDIVYNKQEVNINDEIEEEEPPFVEPVFREEIHAKEEKTKQEDDNNNDDHWNGDTSDLRL